MACGWRASWLQSVWCWLRCIEVPGDVMNVLLGSASKLWKTKSPAAGPTRSNAASTKNGTLRADRRELSSGVRGRVLRRVAKAPRVRLLRLHAAQPVAAAAWDESLMAVWALERAGAHLHSAPQWDLKGEMRQHSEPSTSYPPAVAFHLFGLDTPIFVFNRPMD